MIIKQLHKKPTAPPLNPTEAHIALSRGYEFEGAIIAEVLLMTNKSPSKSPTGDSLGFFNGELYLGIPPRM